MQSPTGTPPEPGERRRLDHPPSDRFATDATDATPPTAATEDTAAPPSQRELVLRGVAVGLSGAIALTLLGGPLSITAGLVGAAAVIGWLVGRVTGPARVVAVTIAVGSVALGLVGIWLFAGLEGGTLGLVDYLAQVQGFLVPIELVVAGTLAAAAS